MSDNSRSIEYRELVQISNMLHQEYIAETAEWNDSPFGWIKQQPSRTVGAIGEKIISAWLAMHDFNVSRSPDSGADRIVEGKRVEIKFSTLWKNGSYTFQQLRDQNYDFIIMMGLSPHDAHCWVVPKKDIIRLWKEEHIIEGQHTGGAGADTAWVHLTPQNDMNAMKNYGNTLSGALKSISKLTGFNPKTLTEAFDN